MTEEQKLESKLFSNKDVVSTMYELGMHIVEGFITRKEVYQIMYRFYGNTILFSRRSLKMATVLYTKYQNIEKENFFFTWYTVLYQLLKKKNSIKKDLFILRILQREKLNEKESLYYLRYGTIDKKQEEEDFLLLEFKNLFINGE